MIARFVSTINHWGRFQYSAMNTYYVAFHFHKGQIFNHLQELSRKNTYQPELFCQFMPNLSFTLVGGHQSLPGDLDPPKADQGSQAAYEDLLL